MSRTLRSSLPATLVALVALTFPACEPDPGDRPDTVGIEASPTATNEVPVDQSQQDQRVDYVEFLTTNMNETKAFYTAVFGWTFTDYGPDYASFHDGRLGGGFAAATEVTAGGPLIVIYAVNLEDVGSRIAEFGGRITREIFDFPGGRRFHFTDPSGNQLAVWSDR